MRSWYFIAIHNRQNNRYTWANGLIVCNFRRRKCDRFSLHTNRHPLRNYLTHFFLFFFFKSHIRLRLIPIATHILLFSIRPEQMSNKHSTTCKTKRESTSKSQRCKQMARCSKKTVLALLVFWKIIFKKKLSLKWLSEVDRWKKTEGNIYGEVTLEENCSKKIMMKRFLMCICLCLCVCVCVCVRVLFKEIASLQFK